MKPGDYIIYAGSAYEVADVKPPMVGIYDDPPSRHIDYVQASSVTLVTEYADDDLGELDASKACRIDGEGCESCQ